MKVAVIVHLEVTLLNADYEDQPDPAPDDARYEAVRRAAYAGICAAVRQSEMYGFHHGSELLVAITVDEVALAAN